VRLTYLLPPKHPSGTGYISKLIKRVIMPQANV
jgi:hypothetical protein